MEDQVIQAGMDIFQPVMESAMILAGKYATACGRDIVLGQDVHMGLMYAARHVTGKHLGTLFPGEEEGDESDPGSDSGGHSDSDSSWETVEDEELTWTRYEGTDDEMALKMNECADTWDAWHPETPAESALKGAVNHARARGVVL